jgi:hypothetical protein
MQPKGLMVEMNGTQSLGVIESRAVWLIRCIGGIPGESPSISAPFTECRILDAVLSEWLCLIMGSPQFNTSEESLGNPHQL